MKKIAIALLLTLQCFGCCDFLLQSQDGAYVVGRSMEFGKSLAATAVVYPRGTKWTSQAPGNKIGLSWESKYGFLALVSMGMDDAVDGMNEKGLSAAFLWMPSSKYPDVPEGKSSQALAVQNLSNWALANFATVAEVKTALANVYVWGAILPQMQMIPPLHLALHDAQGNSAVIEFMDGQMQIYDNPLGVLTNFPSFDWHLTNLSQYLNLRPQNASPVSYNGYTINQTGQGSGMVGLPGDLTPPSRFVRVFSFKQFASQPKTVKEATNLALHILNTVDIPFGVIQEKAGTTDVSDYTQWIVVKDLTNKKLYFRTYDNPNLYTIDFSKIELSSGRKYKTVPLNRPPAAIDVTGDLRYTALR